MHLYSASAESPSLRGVGGLIPGNHTVLTRSWPGSGWRGEGLSGRVLLYVRLLTFLFSASILKCI